MIVAAVDYGRQRIGIAISEGNRLVIPVAVIQESSRAASIAAVTRQLLGLGTELVVIGYPLEKGGVAGRQAGAAKRFGEELSRHSGLPIELYDEHLTSFAARERLRATGARIKSRPIDAIAACIILESWLREHP